MSVLKPHVYQEKDFSHLTGLTGISDDQLKVHFGLYSGYVANVNKVNQTLADLDAAGKTGTPEWAEVNRRAGWEYNGMRLHEYYFEQFKPGGNDKVGARLEEKLKATFGSIEDWKADFVACGGMRGIGWVILYLDPKTGVLSNHYIPEHDIGHPAGFTPILVMDVWEHAFMVDYKPPEKKKYMEAFFTNIDWTVIEKRL